MVTLVPPWAECLLCCLPIEGDDFVILQDTSCFTVVYTSSIGLGRCVCRSAGFRGDIFRCANEKVRLIKKHQASRLQFEGPFEQFVLSVQ